MRALSRSVRRLHSSPLLVNQSKLPRLPIPPLEDTLTKYLTAVQAFGDKSMSDDANAAAKELLSGDGPRLQQALLAWDKARPNSSYLAEWWEKYAYTADRNSVMINSNPFFLMTKENRQAWDVPSGSTVQLDRATRLVWCAANYASGVAHGTTPLFTEGETSLCMSQLVKLFGTTRVPKRDKDEVVTTWGSKHIAVLCQGKLWTMQVLSDTFDPIPPVAVGRALKGIMNTAGSPDSSSPCPFTGSDRNQWADARKLMEGHSVSKTALEEMDKALFVLCLDSHTPASFTDLGHALLHNHAQNRWMDKSFQIVVFPDGNAGVNMEHSWGDGFTVMQFAHKLWEASSAHPPVPGIAATDGSCPARRLEWGLTEDTKTALAESRKYVQELVGRLDLQVTKFFSFGNDDIKQLKCSPDAFCQLSFQVASARQVEGPVGVYESCNVMQFLHGRTECIRSNTIESQEFVRQFLADPNKSVPAFRKAAERHLVVARECKAGLGFDRHLLGLRLLVAEKHVDINMPRLFTLPAYKKVTSNMLSTSQLPPRGCTEGFGFGPVESTGVGIGYMIAPKSMTFGISSWKNTGRDATQFTEYLFDTLFRLYRVLSSTKA